VQQILKQRLVKVDGKVKTDVTYPTGIMDVVDLDKTDEHFRLVYDTKGRFVVHRISKEEAAYKLCKVRRLEVGKGGVPYIGTHDGRTIRYPDPEIKVRAGQTIKGGKRGLGILRGLNFTLGISSDACPPSLPLRFAGARRSTTASCSIWRPARSRTLSSSTLATCA
jgi:ribosomal protein S4E